MMRRLGLLAASAALATACGTTVPTGGVAAPGQDGLVTGPGSADGTGSVGADGLATVDGGAVPGAGGGGSDSGAGSFVTTGSADAPGSPGSSTGSTGSFGGPGSTAVGSGGNGATAPGVTASSIFVGVTDSQSQDQVLADAGIKGGTQGSNEKKATALVNHVNKAGGIAGRKLVLRVYTVNSSSTEEAICAYFTQDKPVFAVLSYGQASGDELRACLAKKRVVFLSDHGTHFDSKTLRESPGLWPTLGLNVERKIPAYIDGLKAQGYFTGWNATTAAPAPGEAKVGLLYYDEDFNKRHNPRLRAAMAKHGLKFFREFGIRTDNNGQADLKAAVLRFASDGVTHVVFNQEINAAMFGLFALNANSQGYYPRYGVSSYDFPSLTAANLPDRKVLHGLKGIGWLPFTDVDEPRALGPLQNSCLKVYEAAGQLPADTNERTIMLINCDVFFKFSGVASKAGTNLNLQSFFAGVTSLGANVECYVCDKLDYSRHIDGIASVSFLEYGSDCDCIRYTKTGIPTP